MTAPSYSNLRGLTLEDAYAKLDEEIGQLEGRLRSLRALRNSLPHISKIPTEILSKIFFHTQESTEVQLSGKTIPSTRFFVSWVSRHWRNTAIATPSLWTIISTKTRNRPLHMEFAQELLMRSRNLPLAVNLPKPTKDVLQVFCAEMHRIQHLRLLDAPKTRVVGELLAQAAPVLASLQLTGVTFSQDSMFSGIHPHLTRLRVGSTDFDLPSSLITPALTRLHLSKINNFVDPNDLIALLPSLQNLTKLVLVQPFEDEDIPIISPPTSIRLPNLQILSITETKSLPVRMFLQCLDIPNAAIAWTWPKGAQSILTQSVVYFLMRLKNYLQTLSITVRHLKITRQGQDTFVEFSSTPSQHRYSFHFPTQSNGEDMDTLLGFMFPLDDLETLSINEITTHKVHILMRLPKLRSITLSGRPTLETFITQLVDRLPRRILRTFTALKELTISDVGGTDWKGLGRILAVRQGAGMGMDKLIFVNCPQVGVDKYRSLVNNVLVDN